MSIYQSHYSNRNHTILFHFYDIDEEDRKRLLPYLLYENDILEEDVDLTLLDNGCIEMDPIFPYESTTLNIRPSNKEGNVFILEGTKTKGNGPKRAKYVLSGKMYDSDDQVSITLGIKEQSQKELEDSMTLTWVFKGYLSNPVLKVLKQHKDKELEEKEFDIPKDFNMTQIPTKYLKKKQVKELKKGSGTSANN